MRCLPALLLLAIAFAGNTAQPQASLKVMLLGNSLVYTQNVPGLLRALAAAQSEGPNIETATFVAPGGTLAERWKDGVAAKALREGQWDVLVLQERGGLLACMASPQQRQQPECRASQRAHKQFAELAKSRGARVLLFGTWGPDAAWQQNLDRGLMAIARSTGAETVELGEMLRAQDKRQPALPMFADGVHASLEGALLIAARLYRSIAGRKATPADLDLDFALLPANARVESDSPMEQQPQLAGDGKRVRIPARSIAALLTVAQATP